MKKALILLVLIEICLSSMAAPLVRRRVSVTLTDGTAVTATMRGDEYCQFLVTDDGRLIEETARGYAYSSHTLRDMAMQAKEMRSEYAPQDARRQASSQATAPLSSLGSPLIPVVLAEFTDLKFSIAPDIHQHFDLFLNGRGDGGLYKDHGSYGAVGEFFRDQSNGLFTPRFEIVSHVTVNGAKIDYKTSSKRETFRNEALRSATSKGVDWAKYDGNGDGKVDAVLVIFPGDGGNTTNGCIVPCCWSSGAIVIDNNTFATCVMAPESDHGKIVGVGVYCHEMSHMLGLPDMYDTNYSAPGMDLWDLMDYGEYINDGKTPNNYSAYEKSFMGWTTLVELTQPESVTLKPLSEGGCAYRITNDGNPNEYYVLEAHKAVGWDKALCELASEGLLVNHIDYSASEWSSNRVNTSASRQRITIVPANGHFELLDNLGIQQWYYELKGHTYPCRFGKDENRSYKTWGIVGNDKLTDESDNAEIPVAALHSANSDGSLLMHKPITNIALNADGSVTLDFMGGTPDAIKPVNAGASDFAVYTLSGIELGIFPRQGMAALPSGMYIVRNLTTGTSRKVRF